MPQSTPASRAAVAFTVKSGWAAAVLVAGPPASPRVVDSRTVELSDPALPESRQPYHAGFGTARQSGRTLSRLVASVEVYGRRSVGDLLHEHGMAGHEIRGVGIVVGSLIDPERIANAHIRIHALEGRLFRRVVEEAAARSGLPCATWLERDLYARAGEALGLSEGALRAKVADLGRGIAGPWRAEQKVAALAAWLVLAGNSAVR